MWLHLLFEYTTTLELKKVNRSECEEGADYKRDIVEVFGFNFFFNTTVYCFIKCISLSTEEDYF